MFYFIIMIPKLDYLESLHHNGHISLCNIYYKILANWVKSCLNKIVSPLQEDFPQENPLIIIFYIP